MTKLNYTNNAVIWPDRQAKIEALTTPPWNSFSSTIDILREDLLDLEISGNKWRKLKYNILYCIDHQIDTIITAGGNYSNHLAATAKACKEFGQRCIGLIRSYSQRKTATLERAESMGMKLHFLPPNKFERELAAFLGAFPEAYHYIEMGGANRLGILGCEEILNENTWEYDYIAVACGTGSTISGIINSSAKHQRILGFPAYKPDDRLNEAITKFLRSEKLKSKFETVNGYAFGGLGKMDRRLIEFIHSFYETTQIPLDGVYTGKMMFGLMEMMNRGYFPEGSKILAVHTGGLQGNIGLNAKYKAQLPVPSF